MFGTRRELPARGSWARRAATAAAAAAHIGDDLFVTLQIDSTSFS